MEVRVPLELKQALIIFHRSGFFILGAVGYIILIVSRSGALSYVGVYLAAWCVKMIDIRVATHNP